MARRRDGSGAYVPRIATILVVLAMLTPSWRADAQALTCFLPPSSPIPSELAVGSGPFGVALGDLNRTGELNPMADVAVVNNGSDTVSIRGADGDGRFSNPGDVTTRDQPRSIAIGNLDNDGKPDLAIANASGTVSIRLSVPNEITFTNAADLAVGPTMSPFGITIGDIDHEDGLDLVITNSSGIGSGVLILPGTGFGTFGAPINVPVGAGSRLVALGDLDNDGHLDFAVANFLSNNVSIRLGIGDGTFRSPPQPEINVSGLPRAVALGDFSGDGVLDLAVAPVSGNNVAILLGVRDGNGKGTGAFTAANPALVGVGPNPREIAVGDVNGDGKLDLVAANQDNDTVSVRLGNGDGTFTNAADVGVGDQPTSLALGDVDGDGALDLVTANFGNGTPGNGTASIRLNVCDPNLAPTVTVPGQQTVAEDGTLIFSAANGNAITVADPDIGGSDLRVLLSARGARFTLSRRDGLLFFAGRPSGDDETLSFAGTPGEINAALDGLRFVPNPNVRGFTALAIEVSDQGKTGFDGPKTAVDAVQIFVASVNDPPVAANDGYTVVAQSSLTVAAPGVLVNDTDVDSAPSSFTATVVANPSNGSLALAANGGFTYTPNANFAGTDTFTYRAGDGDAQSNVATATITVTPIQCVPRPKVVPSPAAGGGRLAVRVESTPLNTQQNNPLQWVRFDRLDNARVTLNGQTVTAGPPVNVAANTFAVDFAVERVTPGRPTTVHFTVKDGCGEWKTFVGGGTAAGF